MTTTNKQRRKTRPDPEQVVTRAVKRLLNCSHNGHDWQRTLIKGIILCTRCRKLAACRVCVPLGIVADLWGLCPKHKESQSTSKEEAEA